MKEYLLNEVENILIKGEIDHNDPFLFLPACCQQSSFAEA